jgi:hypothetical protein
VSAPRTTLVREVVCGTVRAVHGGRYQARSLLSSGLLEGSVILYCRDVPNRDHTADDLSVLIRCQEDHDTAVRLHSRYFPDEYGIGFAVDA